MVRPWQRFVRPPADAGRIGAAPWRLGWHHIYYLLAAFDLATISFSLLLTHRILAIYTASVAVNQDWAERIASYSGLARLAAAVNAPGNDVFDTLAVDEESARMEAALVAFDDALAAAQADLLAASNDARPNELERVGAAMHAMVHEARRIFGHFKEHKPELAGKRMAEMDRRYAEVRMALDAVQRDIQTIQEGNFHTQTRAAVLLGRSEYIVAAFIVLMVAGVTQYGRRLAGTMDTNQRERDTFVAHLRENDARTRAILAAAVEGIVTCDERGRIEAANPAAERIFGYTASELIGQNVSILMAAPHRAEHDGYLERYLRTGERRVIGLGGRELVAVRKDGTPVAIELSVSEVRVGARRLFTGMLHDISARKRAEALIRKYNEELEATVRERTEVLQKALVVQSELAAKNVEACEVIRRTQEELVRAERLAAVGELSAAVAHGIRNPLASIRLAVEVEREALANDDPLAETLDDVLTEVDRLEGRIRAVLDISRPFAPNLVLADANAIVRQLADAMERRAPATLQVTLALDPAIPPMRLDPAHLHEVLEALTVNGLEAMRGEGELTLGSRLETHDNGARRVVLSVADTGPGIDPACVGRIFDLFYTSKPSGTGIGLALAKRLTEGHGGTLEVASHPGAGTTFAVVLPLGEPAAEHAA